MAIAGAGERANVPSPDRLQRLFMILRQAAYLLADGIGREYGLERPCHRCEEREREQRHRAINRGESRNG